MYHTPPRSPIVVNCGAIQKAEPTASSAHPHPSSASPKVLTNGYGSII
jgi:hypothetical protein